MAVTHGGQAVARVRDGEEMHKLHDILPLPVALNDEMEEREIDEMESEGISLSGHLTRVSDICVGSTIRGQCEAM